MGPSLVFLDLVDLLFDRSFVSYAIHTYVSLGNICSGINYCVIRKLPVTVNGSAQFITSGDESINLLVTMHR